MCSMFRGLKSAKAMNAESHTAVGQTEHREEAELAGELRLIAQLAQILTICLLQ